MAGAGRQGAEGRRLRQAAGLAHAPTASPSSRSTPAPTRSTATAAAGRSGWYPGGWDVRQRHAEPDPKAANAAILEDLAGGATSVLLQIQAPGQAGLSYGAGGAADGARRACSSMACAIALDARENTMDAAGSLIEIWRAAGINENERRGAFNYDPLGVLAKTGTLYYPAAALLRDRRQVRRRLPHHVARHGAAGRRPPLSRGRRQRGPGAGGHAGDAGGLPARLRGARGCGRAWRSARSRSRWRPMPTCSSTIAKLRAARRLVAARRRGLRRRQRRRPRCTSPPPRRSA